MYVCDGMQIGELGWMENKWCLFDLMNTRVATMSCRRRAGVGTCPKGDTGKVRSEVERTAATTYLPTYHFKTKSTHTLHLFAHTRALQCVALMHNSRGVLSCAVCIPPKVDPSWRTYKDTAAKKTKHLVWRF